jgi:hypothetical protein
MVVVLEFPLGILHADYQIVSRIDFNRLGQILR